MQVHKWDSIETQSISDAITRKMFWGENIMVTRWELKPLAVLPEHSHVSEQVTMVLKGSVTLSFPQGEKVSLFAGDMLVIPSNMPHGVEVGPEGSTAIDLFSPIREDFIAKPAPHLGRDEAAEETDTQRALSDEELYRAFQSCLHSVGVKASLEQLMEFPLIEVARLAYERECLSMGRLRSLLGLDKKQAKDLLREWKHGDDHSAASLRKMMTHKVIVPGDRFQEKKSE